MAWPLQVEEPRSDRLAMADADLPSLSYAHLVGDSAGPALRGKLASVSECFRPLNRLGAHDPYGDNANTGWGPADPGRRRRLKRTSA